MMATSAMAMLLGTMATVAIADDRVAVRDVDDLLDHGFEVIAKGPLLDRVDCERLTLRIVPKQPADSCTPKSFRRLKGSEGEFVCVSFRDWACYQVQSSN
jgi:hypothetical protein